MISEHKVIVCKSQLYWHDEIIAGQSPQSKHKLLEFTKTFRSWPPNCCSEPACGWQDQLLLWLEMELCKMRAELVGCECVKIFLFALNTICIEASNFANIRISKGKLRSADNFCCCSLLPNQANGHKGPSLHEVK